MKLTAAATRVAALAVQIRAGTQVVGACLERESTCGTLRLSEPRACYQIRRTEAFMHFL